MNNEIDSTTQPKLPTIELNAKNTSPGTDSWKSTSDSVRRALESYGCFVIEYEGMSSEMYEAMFRVSEEVFALPMETKRKHTSQLAGFGYGGNFSEMPLFEYFGFEHDASHLQPKEEFAALMWPGGNHHFW